MKNLSPRKSNRLRKEFSYQVLEPRQLLAAIPIVTEFVASNSDGLLDENGASSDWIEIYNAGDASVNLAGYTLTDDAAEIDKWTFPSANLGVGQFLIVFAANDSSPGQGSELFTGFSLGASGEYVGLYEPDGDLVSEFGAGGADYPVQYSNVSYGVEFGGAFDQVKFFATPTPGAVNTNAVDGVVDRVTVSEPAGFHDASFSVSLSSATPGSTIYYTLDGSTPSATNGFTYSSPITVSGTTNLRTVATRSGFLTVPDRTTSYIFLDDVLNQSNDGSPPPGWPSNWNDNLVDYEIDPDVIAIEGEQIIKDALLNIPTWSVTTDLDNLFDSETGIYSHAQETGIEWERAASVELINPDGTPGFQVNAGLRIKGAYSRRPENPKHSFKLYFRNEYGDSELNYAVHGNEGVDTFKKIDLRTAQNWSWNFNGDLSTTFVVDELARQNQKDLGQPSTISTWFHLYLNGQYWGIYQTQERHDSNFGASYFGGDPDDYDVIKAAPGRSFATDGNMDAYSRLFDQAAALDLDGSTPNFVNDAAYMKAQGLNPDGTRNLDYEVLLDVDNVIAYVTLIIAGGNRDAAIGQYSSPPNSGLNNYFAIRNRNGDEGFRFFIHDSEHTLRDINDDRSGPFNHSNFDDSEYFNPQTLHQKLMANEEYRIRFADSVQKHFFNGGTMTVQSQIDKLYSLAAEIDVAVYAESARWGDAKVNFPRLRTDWLNALANLRDNYFPNRHDVVLDQFRNEIIQNRDADGNYTINVAAPLFPSVDAPRHLIDGIIQSGGLIDAGSEFRLAASEGTVYYTLDGSDPRLTGGGINAAAIAYDSSTLDTSVVSSGSSWRYNDLGNNLGQAWRNTTYSELGWGLGDAEFGYGDGDETTVVSYGDDENDKHVTTYFRKTFNVAAGSYVGVTLRIRRDDGAVVYLNGVEVARDNLPGGAINFNTLANPFADDDGDDWHEFVVDPSLLLAGNNTLAVEIHQVSSTSTDISFDAELVVSTSLADPVVLGGSALVQSRTLAADGTWSAIHRSSYFLAAASQPSLRISEIYYHPYDVTASEIAAGFDDSDEFEFVEIVNSHPTGTINLQGVQLSNGVSFTFGDVDLGPGERAVVVENMAAFELRYGSSINVLGEWSGGLSNGGETLTLLDSSATEIMSVNYNDSNPWNVSADGDGASLVLNDPFGTPTNRLGKYYSWHGSFTVGGTPGAEQTASSGIVINEILAHTDLPQRDSIELYNPTQTAFNIGGWFLSDSGTNRLKYEIPAGTTLGAGEYIVFDESDFNPTPANPAPNHFALNGSVGDQVFLSQASAGTFIGIEASVDFGATFNGESLARIPNGSGRLQPALNSTLGSENVAAKVGPVIISEVNYHPSEPSTAALAISPAMTAQNLEFIEVTNPTLQTIDMTDWRIRGEVDFDFAAGSALSPGQTLVIVTFDPDLPANENLRDAFRAHYGIDTSVLLVGDESVGNLNNSFGRVSLQQPDTPPLNDPNLVPHVLADEIVYDDLAPWDVTADGTGASLHRIQAGVSATLADNWTGSAPTPGAVSVEATVVNRSLFYNNSSFDGNSPDANLNDDLALANDKTPLSNGNTATFANYSSFIHGINGIMIDVVGLTSVPTVNDFQFRIGNSDDISSWTTAPAPVSISVRPGAGAGSTDRITLVWVDGTITNTWLQVTMSIAGLPESDVFYFGNAIGESGNDPASAIVNLSDVGLTRANQTGFTFAEIGNTLDYNRDERVNLADVAIARTNQSGFTPINLITPFENVAVASAVVAGLGNGEGTQAREPAEAKNEAEVNPLDSKTDIVEQSKETSASQRGELFSETKKRETVERESKPEQIKARISSTPTPAKMPAISLALADPKVAPVLTAPATHSDYVFQPVRTSKDASNKMSLESGKDKSIARERVITDNPDSSSFATQTNPNTHRSVDQFFTDFDFIDNDAKKQNNSRLDRKFNKRS